MVNEVAAQDPVGRGNLQLNSYVKAGVHMNEKLAFVEAVRTALTDGTPGPLLKAIVLLLNHIYHVL